jgi:predicted nucleic acid-binding Zn ribbon protein
MGRKKTDPAGLQREGLSRASQCQAARNQTFLSGQLAPGRTQELQSELVAEGIPL